ncbi:G patch domain-containing protein 4 [Contarinia nasturtii]|uniref:G patch domain-containing protein 4 n=1 Tax=Contarinia nasturtii TaxID=265458 RepID=UPI0012D472A4|nr:G patch domain-containing protein 4 [Contarinia nasturtii]
MDYGKNLLMKYGWKEGEGIGKNSDGILKPIKANLKFDNAGLCYDKAQEFTNHWWEQAFNDAAENLNVSNAPGNVSMSTKDESVEILTSSGLKISINKLKNKKDDSYLGHFKKSNKTHDQESTGLEVKHSPPKKLPSINSRILTDDDILKACGGRTAHKGARHGLSLSGKLSRIDAQEQQMLEKMALNTETAPNIFKDWIQVKKKHKKRQKSDSTEQPQTLNSSSESVKLNLLTQCNDYVRKSKKKLKQERKRANELANSFSKLKTEDGHLVDTVTAKLHGVQDSSKLIKKERRKKSKKHLKNIHEEIKMNIDSSYLSIPPKAKKKKKNKKRNDDQIDEQLEKIKDSGITVTIKKSKKKRDKKKELKERACLNQITKKISKSMSLDD